MPQHRHCADTDEPARGEAPVPAGTRAESVSAHTHAAASALRGYGSSGIQLGGHAYACETALCPSALRARNSTLLPAGVWMLLAHEPQLWWSSAIHSPPIT